MFTLMDLLAIFVTRMTWRPFLLIGSNHPIVLWLTVCVWTNAGISLKASPSHQVSHPFWGQNGLPIFCAYLGELKGRMGKEDVLTVDIPTISESSRLFKISMSSVRSNMIRPRKTDFAEKLRFRFCGLADVWMVGRGQKQLQSCLLTRRTSCVKSMLTFILV